MTHEAQQEVGEYLAGLPLDGPERLQRELEAALARVGVLEQDLAAANNVIAEVRRVLVQMTVPHWDRIIRALILLDGAS